ncbi:MAG: UDP-N-acetylmuramoyl-tripeptide--D-alanyl-D-alanine ligase [Deltaproteobacteria bacterium]|nr:UDP-N-acetylmuramoyl-tripeptide--D-alanyl-D-alanine ligase [Deltaproteobacteria bacterium]
MADWDLGALARAAGSETIGGAQQLRIAAVGTDTRSLPVASLFVALRGKRFDGHRFINDAVTRGAQAVMVDREGAHFAENLKVPVLVVADTQKALGDMAHWVLKQLHQTVVGITGSNGKTTTKEMIAAVLAQRGAVHKTIGNFNNTIGLPLSILTCSKITWACVLEMGMSESGEIARLCEIAEPDVGLITMIGKAHLEQLGNCENVARAKAELFDKLPANGIGIVNLDDPLIMQIAVPFLGKRARVTFGRDAKADVRLLGSVAADDHVRIHLSVAGVTSEVLLPLPGPHNAMNATATAAVAYALGIDSQNIAAGLTQLAIPGGRMHVVRRPMDVSYIDDTYNANPDSMIAGLQALASIATTGRRIAILGDMLELGVDSSAMHRDIGREAGRIGISHVYALGPNAASMVTGARECGAWAQAYDSMEELCLDLDRILKPGDFVLVKGSRGMHMERAVAHLLERH